MRKILKSAEEQHYHDPRHAMHGGTRVRDCHKPRERVAAKAVVNFIVDKR
jgi:hypothetical protein